MQRQTIVIGLGLFLLIAGVSLTVAQLGCKPTRANQRDSPTATPTEATDSKLDDPAGAEAARRDSVQGESNQGESIQGEASQSAPAHSGSKVARSNMKAPPAVNEVEVISFDDLNIGMQADARFRPIMLQYNDGRARELFGKRVNVAGYMNPTDTLKDVKEFILLRNLECKFGPGGQADHLVHVLLEGDLSTDFTDKVVYVEGELTLNPFPQDGPTTWSIYDLKATKVSTKAPPRVR